MTKATPISCQCPAGTLCNHWLRYTTTTTIDRVCVNIYRVSRFFYDDPNPTKLREIAREYAAYQGLRLVKGKRATEYHDGNHQMIDGLVYQTTYAYDVN